MRRWVALAVAVVVVVGAGCASRPLEKHDTEKIKQNADEGFHNLEREENRQ